MLTFADIWKNKRDKRRPSGRTEQGRGHTPRRGATVNPTPATSTASLNKGNIPDIAFQAGNAQPTGRIAPLIPCLF